MTAVQKRKLIMTNNSAAQTVNRMASCVLHEYLNTSNDTQKKLMLKKQHYFQAWYS